MAERGRLMHPDNVPKRRCVWLEWGALGLVEMPSPGVEAHDSGVSSSSEEVMSQTSSDSGCSTDVSDRTRERAQGACLPQGVGFGIQ